MNTSFTPVDGVNGVALTKLGYGSRSLDRTATGVWVHFIWLRRAKDCR